MRNCQESSYSSTIVSLRSGRVSNVRSSRSKDDQPYQFTSPSIVHLSQRWATPSEAMAGNSMLVEMGSGPCGMSEATRRSSCALPDERRLKVASPLKSTVTLWRYDRPTERPEVGVASSPTLKPTPGLGERCDVTARASQGSW